MKIIEGKTMTCQMCDTAFEYTDEDLVSLPGYPCMKIMACPKCHQQIIMVAEEFKEAPHRIIIEENTDENNQETD